MEKPSNEPPSNKKRNILLTTLAIFVIVLVGATFCENSRTLGFQENSSESVCMTEECIQLGAKMLSMMDLKVDPCDDFYEYACGNYEGVRRSVLLENIEEDKQDLKKFIQTYEPQTNSERIALVFMDKCVENWNETNDEWIQKIWENNDLTDLLLEMSKINPIRTGFIKNGIFFVPINTTNKLVLHLSNGIEENSPLKNVENEILRSNPYLKKPMYVNLQKFANRISFIDLRKYVIGLIPEQYRYEYKENWRVRVDRNGLILLDEVVKRIGVKRIKQYLYKKWIEKLRSYEISANYEQCFSKAEKLFPGTLAMIFVKNFVKSENINMANRLFEELKVAFGEIFDENTWIDEDLKNNLREELKNLKSSLGVPDEHKDLNNIDRMYARVEKEQKVEDQSYLTLVRNILKMNSEETFLRVARGESITYQGNPFMSANFIKPSHRVSIAPIFLNFPYIDKNLPEWNMISSVGRIIGHEIGHAFDAKFFFSNQIEDIPMRPKMRKEFEKRINCIIRKYDKFQFPDGSFSNGHRTKQEDSADFIGFNLAYRLFKKLDKKQQKLPGFEKYTVEQNYFQRMAYQACARILDEKSIKKQKEDVHSANKFRINGVLSNSVDFARAFKCEKNSPMNPEKKCPLF